MLLKDLRPKSAAGTARLVVCQAQHRCQEQINKIKESFGLKDNLKSNHKNKVLSDPYMWHWQIILCHDSNCLRHVWKKCGRFFKYGKSCRPLFSPGSVRLGSVKRRGGLILNLPFRCTLQEILIALRKGTLLRSLKT
uniref:Uncharacterized protein n=1 Tax=Glossina pallidipes TaxID=7398 RepID=A0A1A9Z2M0_GLOPL